MNNAENESPEVRKRLRKLLEYVEELVKQAEKPVFALSDYNNVLYYESNLKGQVGIHHDLEDEDGPIWLKIDRIKRIDPPVAPESIREWLTVSRDPFRVPVLETVRVQTMHKEEAAKLVARGLATNDDLQPTLKSGQSRDHVDVVMRLERFTDAKAAVDQYVNSPWREWSEEEKPRRQTIAIYDAFFSLQQAIQSDPEHPIEIVWGTGVSRWKLKGIEIDHPLIEQLVELDIESHDGGIRIRPRDVEPQLALRPFFELDNDGAAQVREFGKNFLAQAVDDREISPFRPDTFSPILREAATQLDTRGVYYPDQARDIAERAVHTASENLVVSDTWAIFARQRSSNVLLGDLDRLKNAVDDAEELPRSSTRLVTEPSGELTHSTGGLGIGGSGTQSSIRDQTAGEDSERSEDFFFPKPFNDEQIAIIKRLEISDGMVVQGPPGTGKTHTIANIICHCLASGKRILVTSKAAEPLVEVRNHIPEGIRDLVISLLTTEREGLKQLEQAVRVLSNTAMRVDAEQLKREIIADQRRVGELREKIDKIDRELLTWAKKHLTKISLRHENNQEDLTPAELFNELIPIMSTIADRRPETLRNAVRIPQQTVDHPKVAEAIQRAMAGKRPFSPISFGNTESKALVQQIEVQGRRPNSTEDWQKISAYIAWRSEINVFSAKWAAIREEFDLPSLEDEGDRAAKWITDVLNLLHKASRILQNHGPQISREMKELFPDGIDTRTILESKGSAAALAEVIELNLTRIRFARTHTPYEQISSIGWPSIQALWSSR